MYLIQAMLFDVANNIISYEVLHTLSPPQTTPDLGGADIVWNPLCDYVNVILQERVIIDQLLIQHLQCLTTIILILLLFRGN